ncbi:MAG TPA: dephospho-CoA kinase [Clostridia bacterium]|nr:dephospho-CoA kinase [Clostridia bacterium]
MSIPIIGLTGQSGAGKTTVCSKLVSWGFYNIDGDVLAREVVKKGSPVLKKLSKSFGTDIINFDGTLNRSLLASRAFESAEKTNLLNSITHPAITKRVSDEIGYAISKNYRAVVIDAAALLESEITGFCDLIVSVVAPREVRLERILARDKITLPEAMIRVAAQKDEQYYRSKSDIIIRNYPPHKIDDEIKGLIDYVRKREN